MVNQNESARLLLKAGANVEAKIDYEDETQKLSGVTALFVALGPETTEVLLAHGADPNVVEKNYGYTPLMYIAGYGRNGNAKSAEMLIRAGAKMDITDIKGRTALHLAAPFNMDVVPVLVKAGARVDIPDAKGQTALHVAASNDGGKGEGVAAIVKANRSPTFLEMRDKAGYTALMRAVSSLMASSEIDYTEGQGDAVGVPAVAALVEAGADIFVKTQEGGTLLHAAAGELNHGAKKTAFLLRKGFKPVDVKDSEGRTPLFVACQYANVDAASVLLKGGANPDAAANDGSTPRQIATRDNQRPPRSAQTEEEKIQLGLESAPSAQELKRRRGEILNLMLRPKSAPAKP
jgi:ankyrin repeat protein